MTVRLPLDAATPGQFRSRTPFGTAGDRLRSAPLSPSVAFHGSTVQDRSANKCAPSRMAISRNALFRGVAA
jgi:hypothetical protein